MLTVILSAGPASGGVNVATFDTAEQVYAFLQGNVRHMDEDGGALHVLEITGAPGDHVVVSRSGRIVAVVFKRAPAEQANRVLLAREQRRSRAT